MNTSHTYQTSRIPMCEYPKTNIAAYKWILQSLAVRKRWQKVAILLVGGPRLFLSNQSVDCQPLPLFDETCMTLDHHERGARHQSVCASEAVLTDGRIRRALQVCSVRLRVASTEQHGRWLETNRWTQAELPTPPPQARDILDTEPLISSLMPITAVVAQGNILEKKIKHLYHSCSIPIVLSSSRQW
jgi:hypothetical protein